MGPLPNQLPDRPALDAFRTLFEKDDGWRVMEVTGADRGGDLVLSNDRGQTYLAVLKTFNEGRADRVTALFAQALLEARAYAKQQKMRPAILIWVSRASPSLISRLVDFHAAFAAREPFAVLSMDGTRYVRFPGLAVSERPDQPTRSYSRSHDVQPGLAFSDLNQWMLKLLLAIDIKRENLIGAEGRRYATATDLARAAGVSVMTATRLIHALKREGFIETKPFLKVVQRRKLAKRWKAEYQRPAPTLPMKFLSPAAPDAQLRKMLQNEGGILGLFAAADALGFGHVKGVPPTVWVHSVTEAANWRQLRRAKEGERPDLVLQQSGFPQSLGRGVVYRDGLPVTDIIQIWLDVSAHPARGAEQAAELEHGVLANVTGEGA
ncbi:helix-turn-helix domain-containing protein [Burkholderia pyrrocinia]|uniref:helix-turn-helix domain-containing protein n=1 Tax=Burkholderia pyrrocinia TaxID=60550 RepID=UPI00215A2432|nr:helix-turn-helix domain-containing protein [Burkholderia pyrrocinia]UVE69242.1 helix-turn-helix domain-containing protein [Burkholderia pyrrocinia]